ncbi:MAG: hypothetical protein ACFFDH_09390 [Promethearchaeota archaeon]
MFHQKEVSQKDIKVIHWLAHHNPKREDFNEHVFYIFNYAVCIGCFAFALGAVFTLIIANIFYYFIVNFINLAFFLIIFLICWIPSILQYTIQILVKKPLKNRAIKFVCRFLYPIGSILLIFKSPLWGFIITIPAGYLIIIIRKKKNKTLISKCKLRTSDIKFPQAKIEDQNRKKKVDNRKSYSSF